MYDFSRSCGLKDLIMDKEVDICTLEQQIVCEQDLSGMDLKFARLTNQSLTTEINQIKRFILLVKQEIRRRTEVK